MRVAIMQPYFMPYCGYFRLMTAADIFVAYDCVQFPRRGWVHRNKLTHRNGNPEWLTLPLAKADRDSTRIADLMFAEGAQAEWTNRLAEFPALAKDSALMQSVRTLDGSPCEYIVKNLQLICSLLGSTCEFVTSSPLAIDDSIRGQDRIIAIARHFGATTYLNSPGGRELYQDEAFAAHNMKLEFLPDYKGSNMSVLERLQNEEAATVAEEIRANL